MEPKLAVVVQIDLDGGQARIVVTGLVTEVNQRGLCPVIDRARRLAPGIQVSVDLSGCESVEPVAVDLMRWAVEQEQVGAAAGPVEFLLPDPETASADPTARMTVAAEQLGCPAAPARQVAV